MALNIANLTLASGLQLTNALLVIKELNLSNSQSQTQRLEIGTPAPIPAEGIEQGLPHAQRYALNTSESGGQHANFTVAVFLSEEAFNAGKPEIGLLQQHHTNRYFSFNFADAKFKGMTLRDAAYTVIKDDAEFASATGVVGMDV